MLENVSLFFRCPVITNQPDNNCKVQSAALVLCREWMFLILSFVIYCVENLQFVSDLQLSPIENSSAASTL